MSHMVRKFSFFVCTIFAAILAPDLSASQLDLSKEVIEKIILNENHCVQSYEEGRIYLRHENIYPMWKMDYFWI